MHWTGSFRDGMRKGHRGFVPIFSGVAQPGFRPPMHQVLAASWFRLRAQCTS